MTGRPDMNFQTNWVPLPVQHLASYGLERDSRDELADGLALTLEQFDELIAGNSELPKRSPWHSPIISELRRASGLQRQDYLRDLGA